jgi:hypothetical protein
MRMGGPFRGAGELLNPRGRFTGMQTGAAKRATVADYDG